MPNVPTLSSTPTSSTAVPGGRLGRGVGQPGVHRPQRRLDRERDEEPEEQPLLRGRVDVQRRRARGSRRCPWPSWSRRHDVQRDQRGQHEQAAEQAVQQELDRRVRALRRRRTTRSGSRPGSASPRRRRRTGRRRCAREDADHHRLEHQQQREVRLDRRRRAVVRLVPGRRGPRSGTSTADIAIRTSAMPSTPTA